MALKDWKKVEDYKWIKKNDTLEIIKNYEFYTVEIYLWETEDEIGKWLNSRRFSKKQIALSYAKQYMRTH